VTSGDFCAHGVGSDPASPFSRYAHVLVELTGPQMDEATFRAVAAQLAKGTLWPGRANHLYLDPYAARSCPHEETAPSRITLTVTLDDISRLSEDQDRSPASVVGDYLSKLVQRASIQRPATATKPAGAVTMKVFYATDRAPSGVVQFEKAFGNETAAKVSFGSVDIALPAQPKMRDLNAAGISAFADSITDLSKIVGADTVSPLDEKAWLAELRERVSRADQPGVLLFVHGYNVSFDNAAKRAAQLSYDLAFPGATVFFSWPSDASVVEYLRDGREAENSGPALAKVLASMLPIVPDGPIYLIAHSMGNRVAINALLEFQPASSPSLRKALREVILAAPDVDQDAFRMRFAAKILDLGPRYTLYASKHDLALGSSQWLNGGKRMGFGGADLYESFGLDSVDASDVTKEFFSLGHSYFGDTKTVLGDLFYLIRHGLAPGQRPNIKAVPGRSTWRIQP
jgi:esterase/lipase superfamily enzyme